MTKAPSAAATARYMFRMFTAQGTPGTLLTAAKLDPDSPAAVCTVYDTHTANPTLGNLIHGGSPAAGSVGGNGTVWTFHEGIIVPLGTSNGFGVMSGGALHDADIYIVWEEDH